MMKRCKYEVSYSNGDGQHSARFTEHRAAMWFARYQGWSEVRLTSGSGRGLVGQFEMGKATPEFAHLDKQSAA